MPPGLLPWRRLTAAQYHGLRREECAQLQLNDLQERRGKACTSLRSVVDKRKQRSAKCAQQLTLTTGVA